MPIDSFFMQAGFNSCTLFDKKKVELTEIYNKLVGMDE